MAVSVQTRRRQAGGTRYTATVRRGGHSVTATFGQRRQAESWARRCEASIDQAVADGAVWHREAWIIRGRPAGGASMLAELGALDRDRAPDTDPTPRADWTLRRALDEYERTVTVTKKGAQEERFRLGAWRRHPLAERRLDQVYAADIQAHIDARIDAGLASMTVRNEIPSAERDFPKCGSEHDVPPSIWLGANRDIEPGRAGQTTRPASRKTAKASRRDGRGRGRRGTAATCAGGRTGWSRDGRAVDDRNRDRDAQERSN